MGQRDQDLIAHPPVSQILIMHWQATCQRHPGAPP